MKGPEHIKPLIMKDVAEAIEMDISTVSRVANGKYVQTDHGVFELKYFFNEGMKRLRVRKSVRCELRNVSEKSLKMKTQINPTAMKNYPNS
jgi:RNA polymerase sigma-54 factor